MLLVRSTLEFASPVFHSSLSKEQSMKIERVQKKALAIILGKNYTTYESALAQLQLEKLDTRRLNLCHKFALKFVKSARHSMMFPLQPSLRGLNKPFLERQCSTSRHFNNAIPFMSRLLNKRFKTDSS